MKVVVLQLHWNNPEERTDYRDNSGLTFHYTPQLRPNDAGTLMIGQLFLNIPPAISSHVTSGVCDSGCAQKAMQHGPVYFSRTAMHMHYLGKSASVDIKRQDDTLERIAMDEVYEYDSPAIHSHDTPIQINPGDSIKITCEFKSTY